MVQYRKFRIGDLFEKLEVPYYGEGARHSDISNIKTQEYCVPVTSAKKGDNGICRWARKGQFKTYGNVISIVYNGAIAAGLTYYQPSEVAALADSYLIRLKAGELNEQTGLYLACAIQKVAKAKFSRENKAVWKRVSAEQITLPADASGKPDFLYMAKHIADLESEHIAELEAYLVAAGLDDYELTDEDKDIIYQSKVGVHRGFKKFRVIDLFHLLPGRRKLSKLDFSVTGQTPVYSSETKNGGIIGYTSKSPDYVISNNTPCYVVFGDHTITMRIVRNNFCTADNVKVLVPLASFCDEVLLFIFAAWRKAIPFQGYARHWFHASTNPFYLPVTSSGDPDFTYMTAYIRAQQKLAIADVVRLKDRIIEETRRVVG